MNVTELKQKALDEAARTVTDYSRLVGKVTRIECEDGFVLPVLWQAGNYAHLCGLDYWKDASRIIGLPSKRFYFDLLLGKHISVKNVSPSGNPKWLAGKSEILHKAVCHILDSDAVVVSGNGRVDYYVGTDEWVFGISFDKNRKTWYPKSLRKDSYQTVMKPNTPVHVVSAANIQESSFD